MNKTLKAALAAFLATGISHAAIAQTAGSPETTVGGTTVYVEDDDAGYTAQGHNGLTISGAVGLPLNPTAIIPNPGSVRVQGNYYEGPSLSNPNFDIDTKYYGIFAAGRPGDLPLEISGGIAKLSVNSSFDLGFGGAVDDFYEEGVEDGLDKAGLALGAKYQLRGLADDPDGVRLAVGVGYNRALLKNMHAYFVASKAFGVGGRAITGHLGLRYDRFKYSILGESESSGKLSVYGGAEVPLDRRGRFSLVGELASKNADDEFLAKMPYSLSLRFQNGNGFAISGGVQRQGLAADGSGFLDADGTGFFISAGQTF